MSRTGQLKVLAVLSVLLGGSAWARPRATLLPFKGPKAVSARRALHGTILGSGRVDLVEASEVFAVATSAGHSRSQIGDPLVAVEVARALSLDAFVFGRLTKQGRNLMLRLVVIDGGSGEEIGAHQIVVKKGKTDRAMGRRAFDEILPSILMGERPLVMEPVDVEPLSPGVRQPWDPAAEPDVEYGVPRVSGSWPRPALEAGLLLLQRGYDLTGATLADGTPLPHRYESGFFPGLWLRAEGFVLGRPGAAWGAEAFVDIGSLESEMNIEATDGQQVVKAVKTTQRMWGASILHRRDLMTSAAGAVNVDVFGGYHSATFELSQRTPLYARNDYGSFRLGSQIRVPIGRAGRQQVTVFGRVAALRTVAELNRKERYPAMSLWSVAWAMGAELGLSPEWSLIADARGVSFDVTFPASEDNAPLRSDDHYFGGLLAARYTP